MLKYMSKKLLFLSALTCFMFFINTNAEAKTTFASYIDEFEYIVNDYGNGEKTITLTKYIGFDSEVFVPSEIDGYPITYTEQTFKNNTYVQRVEFSSGPIAIGDETFYGCTNLKEVILPQTAKSLNKYAFAYSGIDRIILPKETHYVGEGCFYNCKNLSYIKSEAKNIPFFNYSVSFDEYAFFECQFIVIQIVNGTIPDYESNTFDSDFRIVDNPLMATLYNNKQLRETTDFLVSKNMAVRVFVLIALFVFISLVIYAFRKLILKLLNKDALSKYKKYERNFVYSLPKQNKNYIVYPKVISLTEKLIIAIKIFFCIIFWMFWMNLGIVIFNNVEFPKEYMLKYSFAKAILVIIGYFLITLIAISSIMIVKHKLNQKKKKKHNNMVRIKVRKVGKHYYDK